MENIKNCILEKVEVIGMWGEKYISTDISNINIFVGYNGTGKTTFITIIEAVLSADTREIARLNFKECNLYFSKNLKITCGKKPDKLGDESIHYRAWIGNKKILDEALFDTMITSHAYYQRLLYINSKGELASNSGNIKNFLNNVVHVSWLSVDRKIIIIDKSNVENKYVSDERNRLDTINCKLDDLIVGIQKYKSKIELKERDLLDEFRKNVFELMLYKEELDSQLTFSIPENDKWVDQLKKAFIDLGLERLEDKIEDHVKAVKTAFEFIKNPGSSGFSVGNPCQELAG